MNAWGVEPGQTWIHHDAILLVLEEVGGHEWFRCLVLVADPECWVDTTRGPIVRLTAYLVASGGRLV